MVDTTDTADTLDERQACAHELAHWLMQARHLRVEASAQPLRAGRRQTLRAFQADRLARTHADLLASTRYRAAAEFFLSDLYGPKDLGARDAEIERVLPLITRSLPTAGLHALRAAAELDALSEQLDAAMVAVLADRLDTALTDADYATAYRQVGDTAGRDRQIDLIEGVGRTLDSLAHKPGLATLLKMMRRPAQLAGLGELQSFLERGFSAFRSMRRADEFVDAVTGRERDLSRRLFDGTTTLSLPPAHASVD
jgi:hypothetical protein